MTDTPLPLPHQDPGRLLSASIIGPWLAAIATLLVSGLPVWLASILSACLVTLGSIGRELGIATATTLTAKQATIALLVGTTVDPVITTSMNPRSPFGTVSYVP